MGNPAAWRRHFSVSFLPRSEELLLLLLQKRKTLQQRS
jgi:hypothetical protein